MDPNGSKDGKSQVMMGYSLENCFRHVFKTLDFKNDALLNVSQLKVVCANICRVLDISFIPEDLEKFNNNSSTLQADGFVSYVRELMKKAQSAGKVVDFNKLEDICWVIINKVRPNDGRVLDCEHTLCLLKVFNKIDIDNELVIHKDEARIVIEYLMTESGITFDPSAMESYSASDHWTFWNLLECIEKKYIADTLKRYVVRLVNETVVHSPNSQALKRGYNQKHAIVTTTLEVPILSVLMFSQTPTFWTLGG
eukprot:gene14302-15790_t